jgi:hypothetical protein
MFRCLKNLRTRGFVAALILAGCAPTTREVTRDKAFVGAYRLDTEYELVGGASLIRAARDYWGTGARFYLSQPRWVAGIEANRPGDSLAGELPVGTHLRVVKFVAVSTNPKPFYGEELVRPLAVVLGQGKYARSLVDIAEISSHDYDQRRHADICSPSPKSLRPVETKS